MMDQLTKTEAKRLLNVDLEPGEYEIGFKYEGGVYNPTLATFVMEPLGETKPKKIQVVADPTLKIPTVDTLETLMEMLKGGIIDKTEALRLLGF